MREAVVETPLGALRGTQDEGVFVFRGVRFARPPVDELRFCAPQPAVAWSGIASAERSGSAAWQVNPSNEAKVLALTAGLDVAAPGIKNSPPFSSTTYFQPSISEDCLFLDIWVPPGDDVKLPVFLYYHGGANAGSAGSMVLERGARLAREERVIVVRPNYRMGALGWVHFGLDDSASEAINLGVQDQIAALRWVHETIACFGGDPANITVGGESAGATAVSHLLLNRTARPMIRRAILQSLSPFNQWCTQKRPQALDVVARYRELLSIRTADDLRTVDADALLAVNLVLLRRFDADLACAWRPLGAVVDGDIVPAQPVAALSTEALNQLPRDLMLGFAKDEWQFFRGHGPTLTAGSDDDVRTALARTFGTARADVLLDRYRSLHPESDIRRLASNIMSFAFFKLGELRIAEHLSKLGHSCHVFQFSYDLPGHGGYLRAVHTGDMPFIWRNVADEDLRRWPAFDGIDRANMERSMRTFGALYGEFIRTGQPGPAWPAFDERQTVLWFGEEVRGECRLLASEMDAFEAIGVGTVDALEELFVENLQIGDRGLDRLPHDDPRGRASTMPS